MGAGSVHQPIPKSSSMGFLMPLYTIAIVSFFIYTIMKVRVQVKCASPFNLSHNSYLKLVFKKPQMIAPYGPPVQPDPVFHKQVFEQTQQSQQSQQSKFKRPEDVSTKLGKFLSVFP